MYEFVHTSICYLLKELDLENESEEATEWNYLTDIETNEIRPEYAGQALDLLAHLHNMWLDRIGDGH